MKEGKGEGKEIEEDGKNYGGETRKQVREEKEERDGEIKRRRIEKEKEGWKKIN